MNLRKHLIFFLIIFVVASYLLLNNKSTFFQKNNSFPSNKSLDTKVKNDSSKSFSVVLLDEASPNNSGIALFEPEGSDKTKITIKLVDLSKDYKSALIHRNKCNNIGDFLYPLNQISNGSSETILGKDFVSFQNDFPLSIAIYESSSQAGFKICSDIMPF